MAFFALIAAMMTNIISGVDIPYFDWLSSPVLFIIVDDKGGVGKSFIAQLIASIIRCFDGIAVKMIDSDTNNSSSAQTDSNTQMLDFDENSHTGVIINVVKEIASGAVQHAVLDVGAREEEKVLKLLPWLMTLMGRINGRVVVIRPITLGSHNQRNAALFMDLAEGLRVPVVFVCNEGQGRLPNYFDRWRGTETCKQALRKGAVQTSITDADVRYVDEAVGFGLSMMDVALGDFSKLQFTEQLPADADEEASRDFQRRRNEADLDMTAAREVFDINVQAFINEWLRSNVAQIGTAIQEAIDKRADLDRGATSAMGERSLDTQDAAVPHSVPTRKRRQ